MPIHPLYIVKNPSEPEDLASSVPVLRTSDSSRFLATKIPEIYVRDVKETTYSTQLAQVVIPTAGLPVSRILNHPNIVSIVDIIHTSALPGSISEAGEHGDLSVWEDMDAGLLSYLLPAPSSLPDFRDEKRWHVLAAQNFQRFSLPESLCWHVLRSISKALLWLHYGVKETAGIPGEVERHDDDWQPILIMDVSPAQIFFQHPKGDEYYGVCKLGGFQHARVTGSAGGKVASAPKIEDAPLAKQHYWAPESCFFSFPEIYQNLLSPSRASEIWSLGAVIYTMMTGMPPPRIYEHSWQISRMNDKGFTEGIRDIVAVMLKPHPGDRPNALQLVDKVEDEWARWRSTCREGQEFIDVEDARVARRARGASRGLRS